MAEKFEGLEVWQRSHKLVLKIYKVSSSFSEIEKFALSAQLRRAAISIAANIAEGSTAETKNHLILAKDLGYITQKFLII